MEGKDTIKITDEDRRFRDLNRATYNSGKMAEAYAQAAAYYAAHPGGLYAKFAYAVMSGDYSEDASLPEARRKELLAEARRLSREIYELPDLPRWELASVARNEYFWFHGLHAEQYALGEERVAAGEPRGYYSMCVGAACLAGKTLREGGGRAAAEIWAARAVRAFHAFEKMDPLWFNINPFYARALAILGDGGDALAALKDMYRKQGAPVNEAELARFHAEIEELQALRGQPPGFRPGS